MYPCIQCGLEVRPRQHAVSCDRCERWQHRKCNTGITNRDYLDANKGLLELTFICEDCRIVGAQLEALEVDERNDDERNDGNAENTVNERDANNVALLSEMMEVDANDRRDVNDANNVALLAEMMEVDANDRGDVNDHMDAVTEETLNNTLSGSFNISQRNFTEALETSDAVLSDEDELPANEILDQPTTYKVLPTGSKRGQPLLISSDGYSYGIKTSKNDCFDIDSWCVYDHSIRTNNHIEAWHRRLNSKGTRLSFYKLVTVLQREAEWVRLSVEARNLETEDHATALDLMKTLQKMKMTLDVLQKTRIGMTVNNFRKSTSNDEVISLAKTLIKSWKKLLSSDSQTGSQSSNLSRSNSIKDEDSMDSLDSKPSFSDRKNSMDTTSDTAQSENNVSQTFPTSDPVRLKCRELLTAALKGGTCEEGVSVEDISAHIEDCIHKEFGRTDMKYKNRVRSRVANLKDARNPALRQNVLNGFISPERMAAMTAEEMASDDLKELRNKLTKEAIDDHQMGKTGGTQTDLLKCGKCLKSNCTYNQLQTRSSDEPMTTFCFCNECGHRWKFC